MEVGNGIEQLEQKLTPIGTSLSTALFLRRGDSIRCGHLKRQAWEAVLLLVQKSPATTTRSRKHKREPPRPPL
jgi:hypothetical protein